VADRIILEMGILVEIEPMVDPNTTPCNRGEDRLFIPGLVFPLSRLDEQCSAIPTRTMHFEKHWRLLESMKAQYVAGNGFRKVSCVLSSNLRHVRVFEMDIDDEWELDESSDEEEEASNKPVKIKEEVLSESEAENPQARAAAAAPDVVIKVEKLDPELDS